MCAACGAAHPTSITMPKKVQFTKNSIIYFRGEESKEIYLVSEGEIQLNSDVFGVERSKRCLKGNFFGLHSAIGGIGRTDDAISLTPVELLVFDVKEFEDMVTKTPRLSLQLMQMLSHELRQVHKKTQAIMEIKTDATPDTRLFMYAKTYFENHEYSKAMYVCRRYAEQFPRGDHIEPVLEMMKDIQSHG